MSNRVEGQNIEINFIGLDVIHHTPTEILFSSSILSLSSVL